MSRTTALINYLRYRKTAFTDHDLHSPFMFDLYTELIRNKWQHYDFEGLDDLRAELLTDNASLDIADFGAGSKIFKGNTRLVKDIARHGICQKKYAEFLYRLVNKFAPSTIVELGTSLGLTTLYLAKACPGADLYTIEGSEHIAAYARTLFNEHNASHIHSLCGNFDSEFPKLLDTLPSLDFLYVDGNHAYEPTMRYFHMALKKKTPRSVFVFDDIHWSEGMEKAWSEIKQHPDVTVSIDLFQFGIVFFRKEQKQAEHFILRY